MAVKAYAEAPVSGRAGILPAGKSILPLRTFRRYKCHFCAQRDPSANTVSAERENRRAGRPPTRENTCAALRRREDGAGKLRHCIGESELAIFNFEFAPAEHVAP